MCGALLRPVEILLEIAQLNFYTPLALLCLAYARGSGNTISCFGELLRFVLHFDQGSEGEFCFVENGVPGSVIRTLFEIADGDAGGFFDAAFFGFFTLGEDIEQSGFSAAVGTDESDFVSGAELKGDIDEYRLGRKVLA